MSFKVIILLTILVQGFSFKCIIENRFESVCVIYDFESVNCKWDNLSTCRILDYLINEYHCPVVICERSVSIYTFEHKYEYEIIIKIV